MSFSAVHESLDRCYLPLLECLQVNGSFEKFTGLKTQQKTKSPSDVIFDTCIYKDFFFYVYFFHPMIFKFKTILEKRTEG